MSTDMVELRVGGSDLNTWADEARKIHQIALSLAGTSFVPRSMQGRPDEVTGAILAGRELGLEPMASLRALDIIDGTPTLRAVAYRGLVQSRGHQVWVEESTETRAVVRGRRKGEPNVQTSTWTAERARKAGLAGKKNWQAHPAAMLVARATAEVCRLIAADVLIAVPYVTEEIDEGASTDASADAPSVPESHPKRRTAQRKPLVRPAGRVTPFAAASPPSIPGPSVDDIPEQDPDAEAPSAPDGITDGMRRALMAAFRDLDVSSRDDRLTLATRQLGRPVASVSDLSYEEGHELLAALTRLAARDEPGRQEEGEEP